MLMCVCSRTPTSRLLAEAYAEGRPRWLAGGAVGAARTARTAESYVHLMDDARRPSIGVLGRGFSIVAAFSPPRPTDTE
jgi:hypothetical protein